MTASSSVLKFKRLIYMLFAGCMSLGSADALAGQLLLTNGRVNTQNPAQPWADAILIDGETIKFVGDAATAQSMADVAAEIVDLQGKLVLPGLHDVHMHPLETPPIACLLQAGRDPEGYADLFSECKHYQKGTDWVMGWGHYVDDLLDIDRLPKDILDDSFPNTPALMMGFTSHTYWANSKALELAGITADTPNPIGGVYVKDAMTGEPTGLLLDNAGIMVEAIAMQDNALLRKLDYASLNAMMGVLNRYGLTSIADARVFWRRGHHQIWQRLADEGNLTVRATLGLWAYPEYDDGQLDILKSLYSNDPDSLLKITQIKFYMDGIPGVGTAAMHDPYNFDYGWIAGNRGLNYFTQDRLVKYIKTLEPIGFDAHIHAIGDRGIHEALNAIEMAQDISNTPRHRLTHLELLEDVDIPQFKNLGVIADFQVAGDWSHPDIFEEEDWILGDRAYDAIPIKSTYDAGAVVTLSSDFDVSDMNPFVGMQNALTRGRESLPTVSAVVEAYTINGAYALRQEDVTGSLEVGKFADLIVVDQNIFEIDADEISQTQVLLTLLGGKQVFRRSGL